MAKNTFVVEVTCTGGWELQKLEKREDWEIFNNLINFLEKKANRGKRGSDHSALSGT